MSVLHAPRFVLRAKLFAQAFEAQYFREWTMIARMWHGRVPLEKSAEYLQRMRSSAIPDYQAVPGNRGAFVLHHVQGDVAHFITLSFWESRDAIVQFAGENIDEAKYYDYDRDFLLELEPTVKHYDLYRD